MTLNLHPPNPSGFCLCGCGKKTSTAKYTSQRDQFVKGEHVRYFGGHGKRTTLKDKLSRFTINNMGYTSPCHLWTGYLNGGGYPVMGLDGNTRLAHRVNFEYHNEYIDPNLSLDHLCRVRSCINPVHLEQVTHEENSQRGDSAKNSWDDVNMIRYLYNTKNKTRREIANEYNLTWHEISAIINHKIWKL